MEPFLRNSDLKPWDPEPNYTCMECGKYCETQEVVYVGGRQWDYWCYCDDCQIDTFHMAYGYSEKEVKQGHADH